MRQLFLANMTALGIPTVVSPGKTLHIDWVNATTSTPETLLELAGKSYVDWYMLTQARAKRDTTAVRCALCALVSPGQPDRQQLPSGPMAKRIIDRGCNCTKV